MRGGPLLTKRPPADQPGPSTSYNLHVPCCHVLPYRCHYWQHVPRDQQGTRVCMPCAWTTGGGTCRFNMISITCHYLTNEHSCLIYILTYRHNDSATHGVG
jgi:hypothetical protein